MDGQVDVQRRDGLYGLEFRDVDNRRSEDRKCYNIKQLWQRNHEILNLVSQGLNHNLVAEIVGVTPACVSQTVNSDLGKAKLSEIRQERDDEAKKIMRKFVSLQPRPFKFIMRFLIMS
jgi:DNA-binding NarL/FixJ family response regulator